MKLTTSKGNEYTVDWIDGATVISNEVILQMNDARNLSVIAGEFEGLEWMKRESDLQGSKEFHGFNTINRIYRLPNGKVQIALCKKAVNTDG